MALNVKNPQTVLEKCGATGCLYLSYAHMCHLDALDALSLYKDMINRDLIDEDFFCKDGNKIVQIFCILRDLPIKKVVFVDEKDLRDDQDYIVRYHNPRTGYRHFVIEKGDGTLVFDSFGDSVTRREGVREQYRTLV